MDDERGASFYVFGGCLFRIDDGTGVVLIAFPPTLDALGPGARVAVVGQFLGQGMFADNVHPVGLAYFVMQTWTGLIFGMTASWIVALILLTSAIRLSSKHRRAAVEIM